MERTSCCQHSIDFKLGIAHNENHTRMCNEYNSCKTHGVTCCAACSYCTTHYVLLCPTCVNGGIIDNVTCVLHGQKWCYSCIVRNFYSVPFSSQNHDSTLDIQSIPTVENESDNKMQVYSIVVWELNAETKKREKVWRIDNHVVSFMEASSEDQVRNRIIRMVPEKLVEADTLEICIKEV